MITPLNALIGIILIAAVINIFLIVKPTITSGPGGRLLAFIGIFIMPVLIGAMAFNDHMESSKRTEYCLSCHVMKDYGKSLYVDDNEYIPAIHFQNHRVPKDNACFTCHTQYTMYGDYAAKIRGLRHIYYQYIGTIPDSIKLHEPYNNRECLHCHEGARSFEEKDVHISSPGLMDSIKTNKQSCLASGCHDVAHDIRNISKATFWKAENPKYQPEWMRTSKPEPSLTRNDAAQPAATPAPEAD
jgi:cytochrome c-type protein NapC